MAIHRGAAISFDRCWPQTPTTPPAHGHIR